MADVAVQTVLWVDLGRNLGTNGAFSLGAAVNNPVDLRTDGTSFAAPDVGRCHPPPVGPKIPREPLGTQFEFRAEATSARTDASVPSGRDAHGHQRSSSDSDDMRFDRTIGSERKELHVEVVEVQSCRRGRRGQRTRCRSSRIGSGSTDMSVMPPSSTASRRAVSRQARVVVLDVAAELEPSTDERMQGEQYRFT